MVLLTYQTTSEGSQQYLWLQSRADSFSMSESLMEKSKIPALPLILSGFDDLGSTGTPCCTAQRSRTWQVGKGQRLTPGGSLKIAHEQLTVGVWGRLPVQGSAHSSWPPRGPRGHWAALLSLKRCRLENTRRTPDTHSSAQSGTAGGETPPATNE